MSEIGLVEMTRKRVRESLGEVLRTRVILRSWIYQKRADGWQRSLTRYRSINNRGEECQPFWSTCILPLLITCMKNESKK